MYHTHMMIGTAIYQWRCPGPNFVIEEVYCQQGATAVLALELGGREPHFTLVLGGEPLLTAASHTAPFHVLLLFLHAANTAHGVRPACNANAVASLELLQVLNGWCFNTGMAR